MCYSIASLAHRFQRPASTTGNGTGLKTGHYDGRNERQEKRSVCFSEELAGVSWGFAGVFVFAIGIDVDALSSPSVEAFLPGCQLPWSVIFKTKTSVGEVGGEYVRGSLFFCFG
jgi:hypothetical protein